MPHRKSRKILQIALASAALIAIALCLIFITFLSYTAPAPTFKDLSVYKTPQFTNADFYVSPNGSDDNNGSKNAPFKTVNRAIMAVREVDKNGHDEIIVCVDEGNYKVNSLTFTAEDGGSDKCPIRYIANGNVKISGGTSLDISDFRTVNDYPEIANRIAKEVTSHVMVLDLTSGKYALTAEDFGKLYPIGTYNTADRYEGDTTGPIYTELFINDKRQTLARYPNSEYLSTGEVIISGRESGLTLPNKDPCGDTLKVDEVLGKRIASWQDKNNVWMYGFWQYDWADGSTPISDFDTENNLLTTKYQSFFGLKSNAPYYFYNCLEELDREGEWYLDRERGLLCIYSPENLSEASIMLSTSIKPLVNISCDYISFEGFTFEGTRSDGIIGFGNNISVIGCTIKNISGTAIDITGYNNTVSSSKIYNIGCGAIAITGGDNSTLLSGNNLIYNNLIHDWSEIYKTYRAGVNIRGVGNVCSNNELYNAPHLAITYSGNKNILEYNLIHSVCLESDDAGAIYAGKSWTSYGNEIRYNCIYDIGSAGFSPSGIYMDDAISGQSIYGNLLINIPKSAIFIGGGRDMLVRDNVIINSGESPIFYDARARDATLGETWFTEDLDALWFDLYSSPYKSELWQSTFPEYRSYTDKISEINLHGYVVNPANSTVEGNIIFDKMLRLGNFDEAVKEYSAVKDNKVYHTSLLPFFFENVNDGIYIPKVKSIPDIRFDKIGRQ